MLIKIKHDGPYHLKFKVFGFNIKIKHDICRLFPYKKNEPRIKNYKYVHLMNNGIHSVNIINFINKYFDNKEHCFIFPHVMFRKTKRKLKKYDNVFSCPIKNINLRHNKKIIIHGLFDFNLIGQLYKNKKILKKTYWFIWGGDLYKAQDNKKDNYVRNHVAGILTSFDEQVYRKKFNPNIKCYDVTYPHEITEEMLKSDGHKDYVHVQVNNSADETTIEMLEILSKFKDKPIKVSTILSYKTVGQKNVKILEIMKKGYEIFKEKFNPIIEFLPIEEYAKHLASVDIYISNQDRQQGNGNASVVCSLGHKVYTKTNNPVYRKYNSLGIRYYDTSSIPDLSWEEFCYMDEDTTKKSIAVLKERMKDETKVKQWKAFFEAE